MAGFEKEMVRQRERARAAHKFEAGELLKINAGLDIAATSFVGYHALEQKAAIIKILVDGKETRKVGEGKTGEGQEAGIILDTTPFYGEMGGQVGDTGEIRGKTGRFVVTNTVHLKPEVILHQGRVVEGNVAVGDEVTAAVDMERRRDIARNHTATHLLQAALRQVLGAHVQQRGSLVASERLRFDFSHLSAMTADEIKKVQGIVNDKIRQNLPVCAEETAYKEASAYDENRGAGGEPGALRRHPY
jgi:alanyl-tRNA synthetase